MAGPVALVGSEAIPRAPLTFSLAWAALASCNERHKAGGGKRRAHTKKYRDSRDAIRIAATAHLNKLRTPLPAFPSGPLAIRMRFHAPDRRRRDESNFTKALWDSLTGVVWRDDSQVSDWHGTRELPDPKRPRVEIEVRAA